MSLTCRELLEMDVFSHIQLIGGEAGLDHIISWPYIKQTTSLTGWIYGGELVFEVGNFKGSVKTGLTNLIKECAENKVAGLVVLTGGEEIKHIPNAIIDLANQYKLPLFEMPYNIKLIDISKEISNAIVLGEFKKRKVSNYMTELLFRDFMTEEQLIKEGHRCHIDLDRKSVV